MTVQGQGDEDYYCDYEGLFLDPNGDLCRDHYQCIHLQETWFYALLSCDNDTIFKIFNENKEGKCDPGECQGRQS
jgi:hypothetical protein